MFEVYYIFNTQNNQGVAFHVTWTSILVSYVNLILLLMRVFKQSIKVIGHPVLHSRN